MGKLKHTKLGILSFIIALIPLVYFFIKVVIDIITPIETTPSNTIHTSFLMVIIILASLLTGLVLGLVAMFQKKSRKELPFISVTICGIILFFPLIDLIMKYL